MQPECLFRSRERVESHDMVAREFSDHGLIWHRGEVDTVFYKTVIRQLQVFQLQYGAEVEIRPRPFDDFILVHLTLAGLAEIESDGLRACLRPGHVAVLAPRRDLHMRWQRGSQQFIVKVPRPLLTDGKAGESDAGGAAPASPLQMLGDAESAQWQWLMQSLLHAGSLPQAGRSHGAWIDHIETNIGLFLASRQSQSPHAMPTSRWTSITEDQRRLTDFDRYVQRHLGEPLALQDLARATGVSVRTLSELCKEHLGESPMSVLRHARLDAVRAKLIAHPHTSVTEAALEFGFSHLGRFAGYYQDRFGESPSQTVRAR